MTYTLIVIERNYNQVQPISIISNNPSFWTCEFILFQKRKRQRVFSVSGAFDLDLLHLLKPLLILKFFQFPTSSWEANSYYPRGPIMVKGNSYNPKCESNRGFSVAGVSKLDYLHYFKPFLIWPFSNLNHFHFGRRGTLEKFCFQNKSEVRFNLTNKRLLDFSNELPFGLRDWMVQRRVATLNAVWL